MQDLPQLLCQGRINIDAYLGSAEQPEQENDPDDDQVRRERCCIESELINPMLPILGDPEIRWKDVDDFENIFQMREEIEQKLIHKDDVEGDDMVKVDDADMIDDEEEFASRSEMFSLPASLLGDQGRGHSEAQRASARVDGEDEEDDEEEEDQRQVEVEHRFINFYPIIRKIKIDKIMNRPALTSHATDYLELLKESPEDVDRIEDLFLADLIYK